MNTGFENYSKINVDINDIAPLNIGDVDISSIKEQERVRYSQDTKYRKH